MGRIVASLPKIGREDVWNGLRVSSPFRGRG